jgi:hypothetical protein
MTPAEVRKAGEDLTARTRKTQQLPAKLRDRAIARAVARLLVQPKAGGAG